MPALRWVALGVLLWLFLGPFIATARAEEPRTENPLASGTLGIRPGAKPRLHFQGRWKGQAVAFDARQTGATLVIVGGEATTAIELPAANWRAGKRGMRYVDATGSQGGIRSVALRIRRRGGRVKITGGPANLDVPVDADAGEVRVSLVVGSTRWCATFAGGAIRRHDASRFEASTTTAPEACPCEAGAGSTWSALQTAIFERSGCTASNCHGASPGEGDLDLRPESAYAELFNVPSKIDPTLKRIEPGRSDKSLLWLKLAAKTHDRAGVPGSAMPVGNAPVDENVLRALDLWIYNGADDDGVTPDTERRLAACLPPPTPQKLAPPPVPDRSVGVQLHGPPWPLPALGEDEVCYAIWYDLGDTVPPEQQFPCPPDWQTPNTDTCVFYDRAVLTQHPNSHHSIPRFYRGQYEPTWRPPGGGARGFDFRCHRDHVPGAPCDPRVPDACGAGEICKGTVRSSVACIAYGPPDFSGETINFFDSLAAPNVMVSTEPVYEISYPPGVSKVVPVRGVLVINSHAFNVVDAETVNEQWLDLYYSPPEDRRYALRDVFPIADIFIQNVPPFTEVEYCSTYTFPQGAHVFELTSHTHKRGRLFRAWGPGVWPQCSSRNASCLPEAGAPLFVTTDYADPTRIGFDGAGLALTDADPATRTFKYCAIYDNGATDPSTVKRSTSIGAVCEANERVCLGGAKQGDPCLGDDGRCPGGACVACPLRGGVTSDDEMFLMLGSYYCPEGTECYEPLLAQ
jgi:hypothetical protein